MDIAVVTLLSEVWKASKLDEKGFTSLSEVGQRVSSRWSFDAGNYGFTRLSDSVASRLQFASERREGGMVFIERAPVNCEKRALPGLIIFSTSLLSKLIAVGDASRCSEHTNMRGY